MKKLVKQITKERLREYLAEINWSLRPVGVGLHAIVNHKKKHTDIRVKNDRLEYKKDGVIIEFQFKRCYMQLIEAEGGYNYICIYGMIDKNLFIIMTDYEND